MLNINNISSKSDTFQDLPFVFRDLISLLTEKLSEKRTKKYKKRTVTWKRPNLFQELVTFLWPKLEKFLSKFSKKMHRVISIVIFKGLIRNHSKPALAMIFPLENANTGITDLENSKVP